jgi:mono/diheme cytochrome c family protein
MECAAVPLAALSTGHKVGLLVAAAVFIGFALVSALLIPRSKPDFPGRRMGLYVLVTLLLFVGMMAAVFVFGKEESEAHETPVAKTTTGPPPAPVGNAAAGKKVFSSAGCGACHAFKAAGAEGTTGPNLDEALKGKSAEFIRMSITNPNAEIAKGFGPNIMPQNFGEQLTDKQLDDVVAFLQQ